MILLGKLYQNYEINSSYYRGFVRGMARLRKANFSENWDRKFVVERC